MSMLITFEGGECSGKDSQIKLLEKRLLEFNPQYKVLSSLQEPGSTLKAEVLRMLAKNKLDTDFNFPGDFRTTFDLNKHKNYFISQPISKLAKEYIISAVMNMEKGVKSDIAMFIVNDSFSQNCSTEKVINELQKSKDVKPIDLLLGKYFQKEVLNPEAQLYLYMAARNLLYNDRISKDIKKYDFIILNRSLDSSTVYQGYAQKILLFNENENSLVKIRKLNSEAVAGIFPNLTILLDLPVEEIHKRKSGRKIEREDSGLTKDFFDEKEESFHVKIREGYLKEAEYFLSLPKTHNEYARIKIIDANADLDEVHKRIWSVVENEIKKV